MHQIKRRHTHTHTHTCIQTLQPNCRQDAMRVQLNNEMIDKLQAAQYMRHVIEPTWKRPTLHTDNICLQIVALLHVCTHSCTLWCSLDCYAYKLHQIVHSLFSGIFLHFLPVSYDTVVSKGGQSLLQLLCIHRRTVSPCHYVTVTYYMQWLWVQNSYQYLMQWLLSTDLPSGPHEMLTIYIVLSIKKGTWNIWIFITCNERECTF